MKSAHKLTVDQKGWAVCECCGFDTNKPAVYHIAGQAVMVCPRCESARNFDAELDRLFDEITS